MIRNGLKAAPPRRRRAWVPAAYDVDPRWFRYLVGGTAMFMYMWLSTGAPYLFMILAGVLSVPAMIWVWRHSYRAVWALIVVGSMHPFVMLLLLRVTQQGGVVKAFQLWKELFVIVLVVKAIDEALRARRGPRILFMDLLVVIFLLYAALYMGFPSPLEDSNLNSTVLGFRADALFLFAYFVGRSTHLTMAQVRRLIYGFSVIGFIIAVVGVIQFMAPGPSIELFDMLGFREYLSLQLGKEGVSGAIRSNDYLGFVLPRASSLLLSDLALAFYTLMTVPIAAALFIFTPRLRDKIAANFFLLACMSTTLFTVTRSAIVALVPLLSVVLLRVRGIPVVAAIVVQMVAVLVPVAMALNFTPDVLFNIFSPNEGSVLAHADALRISLGIIRADPFGRGLGTAGQVAQRAGAAEGVTSENWYLHLAVEIGVAAAVLWFVILVTFGIMAFIRFRQVKDPMSKALCLGMAGATAGYIFVSGTLQVWDSLAGAIIYWLFAGLVIRLPQLEREEAAELAAATQATIPPPPAVPPVRLVPLPPRPT